MRPFPFFLFLTHFHHVSLVLAFLIPSFPFRTEESDTCANLPYFGCLSVISWYCPILNTCMEWYCTILNNFVYYWTVHAIKETFDCFWIIGFDFEQCLFGDGLMVQFWTPIIVLQCI